MQNTGSSRSVATCYHIVAHMPSILGEIYYGHAADTTVKRSGSEIKLVGSKMYTCEKRNIVPNDRLERSLDSTRQLAQVKEDGNDTHLSIRCTPEAVSTMPLISPGFKAKAASSNSFCICPLPKKPRSPFLRELTQSDSDVARSPRVFCPDLICSSYPLRMSIASSFDLVMFCSFQLEGLRLPLCLTSKWATLILPGWRSPLSSLLLASL